MFKYDGTYVTNEHGKVMSTQGNSDNEGRNIVIWNKQDWTSQHWDVAYVDEWKGEPGKGELNEDFGLYVQRPFYLITKVGMGRFLEVVDNKWVVIKSESGRNTQQWWFDQKSFTIKTQSRGSHSLAINKNGGDDQIHIDGTKSQWWDIWYWSGSQLKTREDPKRKHERVLTVTDGIDKEANIVKAMKADGTASQEWRIVYVDEHKF